MNKSFKDGVQWAWDATSISLAMTCPRKYQLKLLEGWEPKELSVHLLFGQHYATGLEHFYKYRADGKSIDDALALVVRERLEATWDPATNAPLPFAHAAKTRFTLIRSLVWYVEQFGHESEAAVSTLHLSDGKPAVEVSFSFELSDDILLCGHLDRIVEFNGAKYVMDQKTTGGTIGHYFFDQFKPDNQMSLYTLAGQVILDSPIRGVIIDGAQIAVGFTRFERGLTYRTKDELNEWWETAQAFIHQARSYSMLGQFPMNLASCGNYGGCEFRRVCAASPKVRPEILKSDFIPYIWDPIQRR